MFTPTHTLVKFALFCANAHIQSLTCTLSCTLSPSVAITLASTAAVELRPAPELLLTPESKPPDASKICAWGRVHPVLTVTHADLSTHIARLCILAKFCLFQLDSAYTKIPHLLLNCIRPCHFHVFDWMAFIRTRDAGMYIVCVPGNIAEWSRVFRSLIRIFGYRIVYFSR